MDFSLCFELELQSFFRFVKFVGESIDLIELSEIGNFWLLKDANDSFCENLRNIDIFVLAYAWSSLQVLIILNQSDRNNDSLNYRWCAFKLDSIFE
jgi:hypothetical protein